MPKLAQIIQILEKLAPLSLQEDYDNAGLITGNIEMEITGVLATIDTTEEVVREAIKKGINLIVSHHPIVFRGLKRFVGATYIERTLALAIKHDIAIYAAHTNLDSVANGVNSKIAAKIGLKNLKFLSPNFQSLKKLVCYIPSTHFTNVSEAIFNAGAGHIGQYDHCGFSVEGTGSFRASAMAKPFVGNIGELHHQTEHRFETIFEPNNQNQIITALIHAHPYEEVAYDIIPLDKPYVSTGAGMIGELDEPLAELEFLHLLKQQFELKMLRHTPLRKKLVKKVALCGGSGSFLLQKAIRQEADVFVSADFKYHEFFDAENRIIIADIGHYESEQFTKEIFVEIINENFPNFVVQKSEVDTNPVNYL
ncbi:MAG: hypothetical protein RIS47_1547 [Bacteroidota bacterium]